MKAGRILREIDEAVQLGWFWLRQRRSRQLAVSAAQKAKQAKGGKQDPCNNTLSRDSGRRDSK